MRNKKRPSFIFLFAFLNLLLAKSLEERETWNEKTYQPCGRRHCNPPGKAAWLLVTSTGPCPTHMPQWIFPGHSGLSGFNSLPIGTLYPVPESWLKIAGELFRKGLDAQAFGPAQRKGVLIEALYSKHYFKAKVNNVTYNSTQIQDSEQ